MQNKYLQPEKSADVASIIQGVDTRIFTRLSAWKKETNTNMNKLSAFDELVVCQTVLCAAF